MENQVKRILLAAVAVFALCANSAFAEENHLVNSMEATTYNWMRAASIWGPIAVSRADAIPLCAAYRKVVEVRRIEAIADTTKFLGIAPTYSVYKMFSAMQPDDVDTRVLDSCTAAESATTEKVNLF